MFDDIFKCIHYNPFIELYNNIYISLKWKLSSYKKKVLFFLKKNTSDL